MKHEFWVYIMASPSGTLYIGMTNDIERRAWEHKEETIEGFSKKYGCNRLVFFERYSDVHHAISREKELKGWTRKKKIALIEVENPRWEDLAANWGRPLLTARETMSSWRAHGCYVAARVEKVRAVRMNRHPGDPSPKEGSG